ncbi:MAG TPA: hypothetical protein VF132_12190, partial [Rudaea sp.]
MKRSAGCAIALALAPLSASAVYLNAGGVGQALVYPYYTVNGGNVTLLSVVNTTDDGKAIKVRFLEGYDGRDVFDFNLYLSPRDVWVGQVLADANGNATIFTNDNSCTVPALPASQAGAVAFTTSHFDGASAQGSDAGPIDASRTREGHIELVEMGTVTNATFGTLTAISHVNGVPAGCNRLMAAWNAGGYWSIDPKTDIGPPTGGLAGDAAILDIPNGTVQAYVADAIGGFYAPGTVGSHTNASDLAPNIASGTSTVATVFAGDVAQTLTYQRSIDAVSAIFMTASIKNEYWSSAGIAAASEWIVTYPTKRFYVDPHYAAGSVSAPFDAIFSSGASNSNVYLRYYDREETPLEPCAVIHPCHAPTPVPGMKYEAQVVTFNQNALGVLSYLPTPPSAVLASNLDPFNINTGADYG